MNDLPVGAGDRRAESQGQTAADGPAVDGGEIVVGAGALRRREDRRAVGRRFVDENGVLRHQHAERLPDGFGRQVSGWRRGLGARLTGRRRVGGARSLQQATSVPPSDPVSTEAITKRSQPGGLFMVGLFL